MGGTADDIDNLEIFESVDTENGAASISSTAEGDWTFGSTTKNGRKITCIPDSLVL